MADFIAMAHKNNQQGRLFQVNPFDNNVLEDEADGSGLFYAPAYFFPDKAVAYNINIELFDPAGAALTITENIKEETLSISFIDNSSSEPAEKAVNYHFDSSGKIDASLGGYAIAVNALLKEKTPDALIKSRLKITESAPLTDRQRAVYWVQLLKGLEISDIRADSRLKAISFRVKNTNLFLLEKVYIRVTINSVDLLQLYQPRLVYAAELLESGEERTVTLNASDIWPAVSDSGAWEAGGFWVEAVPLLG
jgi:hypothetical protein